MADDEQKSSNGKTAGESASSAGESEYEKVCGIIRPISPMDYPEKHWEEVHKILAEAIKDIGLTP